MNGESRMSPTQLDGGMWVGIGIFTAAVATFTSDEAAKFLAPVVLFFCKAIAQWGLAGLLSLKMFRSTTYAQYQQEKKQNGNGTTPPFPIETKP